MKVVVLTSSRADYSIYLPLLKKMKADSFFDLEIAAFGTHLSEKFGNTIDAIKKDGFEVKYQLNTLPNGDSAKDISESTGKTITVFSELWDKIGKNTNMIFCLGDRYEMFASVAATIPFNLNVAHLHGGETTIGAVDNIYRHSITHVAKYHFTSTDNHAKRVAALRGSDENVYNVGSLSLENLKDIQLLSKGEFFEKFSIPIDNPVLVTFHPETVAYEKNEEFAAELIGALEKIKSQIIITMPNADTFSEGIRKKLLNFAAKNERVYAVESLGMLGYFSCLNLCSYLLGNSSSGIIEAASFKKYVINIGDRQKGRDAGKNVLNCNIKTEDILGQCSRISNLPPLDGTNIYGGEHVAEKIIRVLKQIN